MGKYPEARIHIESHSQFPDFDGTGFEAALGEELETNSSPLSSAAGSLENDHHALSFAKVCFFFRNFNFTAAQTFLLLYAFLAATCNVCAKLIVRIINPI